ncbi:hypothetical protein TNCV_4385671 [Trichonephila clavipes]|nr:hypothetical protein TNCV_4385671 [Trichonephila clavipes]
MSGTFNIPIPQLFTLFLKKTKNNLTLAVGENNTTRPYLRILHLENQNHSRKTTQQWEEKQFNSAQPALPAPRKTKNIKVEKQLNSAAGGKNSTQQQVKNNSTQKQVKKTQLSATSVACSASLRQNRPLLSTAN